MWSAGYQPSGVEADDYEVSFSEERAEIIRRDGDWSTTLEVVVSSEDDAEVRRISVTNMGTRRAIYKSPPMPSCPWLHKPPMWPIRPLRICLFKRIRAGDRRAARDAPQAVG